MTVDELISLILQSNQHKYLYHFTDKSNFDKINERGLLSKAKMRSEGWWPKKTGGNQLSHELDARRGIDTYVSLCFVPNHPMNYVAHKYGRLPDPHYLKILPSVLRRHGVHIAFGISNSNDTDILPIEEAIEHLDVEVIYRWTDWSNREIKQRLGKARKLEALVPNVVPRNLIEGVI